MNHRGSALWLLPQRHGSSADLPPVQHAHKPLQAIGRPLYVTHAWASYQQQSGRLAVPPPWERAGTAAERAVAGT